MAKTFITRTAAIYAVALSFVTVSAAATPGGHPTIRGRSIGAHNNDKPQPLLTPPTDHRSLSDHDWTAQIESFKPMVVNVQSSSEIAFELESKGTGYATGFIVDGERGIIATNRHVTGTSPSYVKIAFHDGSFTEARTLYYDPTHDFGFYQIVDMAEVSFEMKAVQTGSWRDLALGDEVLLIGNNEKEEYSVKFGRVANLNVNKGDRHSTYIHTTFDRTGGSSGSPVWNTAGEVIGIHARGTDTSSFELPIDYVVDALLKLQTGKQIQRGDVGVDLDLISIGEAIKHFGLPESARDEIGPAANGTSTTPKVIQVEGIIPQSSGADILHASDIIYRIEKELCKDDLYQFDKILDQMVGQSVSLGVYRNGELLGLEIPVSDLEDAKVMRFARFAGAVFHDITPQLRHMLYFSSDGAFMPHADDGSSFSQVGIRNTNAKIVILEINGLPVRSLDDFIYACSQLEDGQHTYVVIRDFNRYNNSPTPKSLTVNLKYDPLEVFTWNSTTLDWQKIDG